MTIETPESLSNRAAHHAEVLLRDGLAPFALNVLRYALEKTPLNHHLYIKVAKAAGMLGDMALANAALRRALELNQSGETIIEVANTLLSVSPPFTCQQPPIPVSNQGMLTMALLGRHGRFGNQLFQYGFLRLYCQEHGLRYQVPEWIGQKLFGLRDEPITTILPFRPDIEGGLFPPFSGTPGDPPTINVDTIGSFEYTTARYAHHRALFRSFYQPIPALLDLVHPYSAALRAQHATLVAVHIRQGDAGVQNRLANIEIYRAELRKLWPTLSDPILFIATDGDRNAVRAFFEEFRQTPLIPAPVLPFEGANFYPDFYLLTQADVLLVSNSTFSYSASMLNTRAKRFIRPDAAGTTLYDFDPWNDLPLL